MRSSSLKDFWDLNYVFKKISKSNCLFLRASIRKQVVLGVDGDQLALDKSTLG